MIVLTEQIEIPASYEKLKAWTANFEEEFVKWSPYHIECNLYTMNIYAHSFEEQQEEVATKVNEFLRLNA